MTYLKYALLCTILVQAMLIQSATISSIQDLDAIKSLSASYTPNYGYQPPSSYAAIFQSQPALSQNFPVQPAIQQQQGYGAVQEPVQQQQGYGAAPQPVQQQQGYGAAPQPVQQQQGYGAVQQPIAAPQPVQQQQGYGSYNSYGGYGQGGQGQVQPSVDSNSQAGGQIDQLQASGQQAQFSANQGSQFGVQGGQFGAQAGQFGAQGGQLGSQFSANQGSQFGAQGGQFGAQAGQLGSQFSANQGSQFGAQGGQFGAQGGQFGSQFSANQGSQFGVQQGVGQPQQRLGQQQGFGQQQQFGQQQGFGQGVGNQGVNLLSNTVNNRVRDQSVMRMEDLPNNCAAGGFPQAIFEGDVITESYCRCSTGSYGRTCAENFVNPCGDEMQYHPADASFGGHYFIECVWGIPYLMKCPATTLWSQELLTCALPHTEASYAQSGYGQGYGGYGSSAPVQVPAAQTQSYGSSVPIQVPVPVQTPSYGSVSAPVDVPVAQTQSYGSSAVPVPVQTPSMQSSYDSVKTPVTQSQSYGSSSAPVKSVEQPSYGGYGNTVEVPALSQPSSYDSQPEVPVTQSQSYGSSAISTPIRQSSYEQQVPVMQTQSYGSSAVPVPVTQTQSSYDSNQAPVSQSQFGSLSSSDMMRQRVEQQTPSSGMIRQSFDQQTPSSGMIRQSFDQQSPIRQTQSFGGMPVQPSLKQSTSSSFDQQRAISMINQSPSGMGTSSMTMPTQVPIQSQFNQVVRKQQTSSATTSSFGQQVQPMTNFGRSQMQPVQQSFNRF